MSSLEVCLEWTFHHLSNVLWTPRLVKGSYGSTCNWFRQVWKQNVDKANLAIHHPLLFQVCADVYVPLENPHFDGDNRVGTLLGVDGGEKLFDNYRVLIRDSKDIYIPAKVRRECTPKGCVLANADKVGEMIGLVKGEFHIQCCTDWQEMEMNDKLLCF
jgi:hypothetical protein